MCFTTTLFTSLLPTIHDSGQVPSIRAMKEKICKQCESKFIPKSGRQDYCNPECKKIATTTPKKERKLICRECDKEFIPTGSTSKFCTAECRILFTKKSTRTLRTCIGCSTDMTMEYECKMYCSTECSRRHRSELEHTGIEGIDYVVCPVCKQRVKQVTQRHAEMHGYSSAQDMAEKLGMLAISCDTVKQMFQGENNPGYQHGGKFSPWSEIFLHGYDESKHEIQKKAMVDLRATHRELFKNNLEYWIVQADGDIEQARILYKKFQTKDLQSFINIYGDEEGKRRHMEKTEKWMNSLNSKTEEELRDINARKVKKSGCFYSVAEKELFSTLQLQFPELTDQFAICRNPDEDKKLFYLYDMQYADKIIEYNGDFWHANPQFYDETFVNPYSGHTYQQIHDKDSDKLMLAANNKYTVKVIWEHTYKKDKQGIIQECINFLKM